VEEVEEEIEAPKKEVSGPKPPKIIFDEVSMNGKVLFSFNEPLKVPDGITSFD
jgi:hypothetical protein